MTTEQVPGTIQPYDAGTPPPYTGELPVFEHTVTDPSVADPTVVDPSASAGNDPEPTIEELNQRKFDYVVETIAAKDEELLTEKRGLLLNAVGGRRKAESTDVWEAVKGQQALSSSREVDTLLIANAEDLSKPVDQKDMFDKIMTSVKLDKWGSKTSPHSVSFGPDVVDFNVGSELETLLDGDALEDPATLAKATKTIKLLASQGLYKFHKWGNGAQLQTALSLIEQYTFNNMAFNPDDAGYGDLEDVLIVSQAALQVDQISKPNYKHAKPERGYLTGQLTAGLVKLRNTKAEMFIGLNPDFEIPAPAEQTAQ